MSKTQVFIDKAKIIHGDRYDYSKSVYRHSKEKLIVICRNHGFFETTPNMHLRRNGCPKCGRVTANRKTSGGLLAFIKRAEAAHGERYDYSGSVYTRANIKISIECKDHGSFYQTPVAHVRGAGCPECSGKKRWTTEEFIVRAKAVHGETYCYSVTEYVRAKSKLKIICKLHGVFNQNPNNHIVGEGCPRCGGAKQLTTKEFVEDAVAVHGDTYDYSLTKYTKSKKPVIIICRKHGKFEQGADRHKSGAGCPCCWSDKRTKTTGEFVIDALAVHGDRYNYDKVDYLGTMHKVVIQCSVHGDFEQRPNGHLAGKGCPLCPQRLNSPTDVYVMEAEGMVKIGYSNNVNKRSNHFNLIAPFRSGVVATWTMSNAPEARLIEALAHKELDGYNAGLTGFEGATEWFNATPLFAIAVVSDIVKEYIESESA